MAAHHEFDRVGYDFSTYQACAHAFVAHRDSVGDGDRVEAPCRCAAFGDFFGDADTLGVEVDVAGRGLAPNGGDSDPALLHVFVAEAHCAEHGAVSGFVGTFSDGARLVAGVEGFHGFGVGS